MNPTYPAHYGRRQALTLIAGWGYTAGSLPRRSDVGADRVTYSVPPSMRDTGHTRAVLELGPKNGAGHQLYRLTFIE